MTRILSVPISNIILNIVSFNIVQFPFLDQINTKSLMKTKKND